MSRTDDIKHCPQCGVEFEPASSPLGLCPSCLLKLGASDPAMSPPPPEPEPSAAPSPAVVAAAPPVRRMWRRPAVAWTVAGILVVFVAMLAVVRRPVRDGGAPLSSVVRFGLPFPEEADPTAGAQFAIAPDATRVALAVRGVDGRSHLWLRALQSTEWRALSKTESASHPFWSPDSRNIAFFADGKLKRIDIDSGLLQTICEAASGHGGTWTRHDVIVFAPRARAPLSSVSASGGTPHAATSLDRSRGEVAHLWPHVLPNDDALLFVAATSGSGASNEGLWLLSLGTGQRRLLVPQAGAAAYAAGVLLFRRGDGLVARRFDPHRGEFLDDVRAISGADQIGERTGFSVSPRVLIHDIGNPRRSQLTWIDRAGRTIGIVGEPMNYERFSISPDGTRIAVVRYADGSSKSRIWVSQRYSNVVSPLTDGLTLDSSAIWSPDGSHVAFASRRDGSDGLYSMAADGSGKMDMLYRSPEPAVPTSWARDGRFLVYSTESPETGSDIWMMPLEGDRKPQALIHGRANESDGQLSPDGRWIAYVSDESGTDEVYVRTVPQSDGRWQVSSAGGTRPRWRNDGRELLFLAGGQLVSVAVQGGPPFLADVPHPLLAIRPGNQYEVAPNGQQFLVNRPIAEPSSDTLQVVLNWGEEIRR